jgi:hypothetical protein
VGTAAAITQQCAENGLTLILEAPPRQGKSEIELVHSPAIHLTKNPNFRYLAITHSQDLANKFVTAAGRIVAEEGFRLKTEKANSFKIDGSVSIDASYQGFGIKGAVSGRGANRIILDDVLKSGTEAMSEKTGLFQQPRDISPVEGLRFPKLVFFKGTKHRF